MTVENAVNNVDLQNIIYSLYKFGVYNSRLEQLFYGNR